MGRNVYKKLVGLTGEHHRTRRVFYSLAFAPYNLRTGRDSRKMKLFWVVLVIYVVALSLFGVDGRGSGSGMPRGVEVMAHLVNAYVFPLISYTFQYIYRSL